MKEKLIAVLGLKPIAPATSVTDEQVVEAVTSLVKGSEARAQNTDREKAIAQRIALSGGALNREQAILAIEQQARADAERKGKKK